MIAALTAFVSVAIGLLVGASLMRALSIGFYLTGSFLIIAGFFVGNRGPARLKGDSGALLFGSRSVRWATPDELGDAINSSAVFVAIGFALILLGGLADTRHRFF